MPVLRQDFGGWAAHPTKQLTFGVLRTAALAELEEAVLSVGFVEGLRIFGGALDPIGEIG